MAKNKYWVLTSSVSDISYAYKIYEVEVVKQLQNALAVRIIRPIAGVFFAINHGEARVVHEVDLFDEKEEALKATLIAILRGWAYSWRDNSQTNKDVQKAYWLFLKNLFRSPSKPMVDVWEFEKTYTGLMKELYHG